MAKFALLDEVSEMAREIRVTWAWWKKNPGPMNLDLAREEFIDILHFAMLIALYRYDVSVLTRTIQDDQDICADMGGPVGDPHNYFVKAITRFFRSVDEENICGVIAGLMNLIDVGSLLLSLEPGDVFHIYTVKNEKNHVRVDTGQTVRPA
jgi:dimeric dUTPase (all-alpha-NTP-PPase superfamily)